MLMRITFYRPGHVLCHAYSEFGLIATYTAIYEPILITKFKSQSKLFDKVQCKPKPEISGGK